MTTLTITLTILVMENLILLGLALIWLNRHCQKCQKVKCIERIFNKICQNCQGGKSQKKEVEL